MASVGSGREMSRACLKQSCQKWEGSLPGSRGPGVKARGETGSGAVMMYGNYDQDGERARDIFGGNYKRLQRLKAELDPTGVFDKLFAIMPDKGGKSSISHCSSSYVILYFGPSPPCGVCQLMSWSGTLMSHVLQCMQLEREWR